MDEDTSWQRQLLVGVGLLVIVGLLVGGLIAVVALKAADVAGVGEKQAKSTDPPPGLFPTTSATSPADPSSTSGAPTTAPTTSTTASTTTRRPPRRVVQLAASPLQAGTYERVNLTGTYRGAPAGASLQVERLEGSSWATFPTSATVNAGTFATYIETGRAGPNRFRVVDNSTGETSNVVVVLIR